jgi:hypothetical protein
MHKRSSNLQTARGSFSSRDGSMPFSLQRPRLALKLEEKFMKHLPAQSENHEIRRVYDEKSETWFFSIVYILRVLTEQTDFQTARKYWNKLKERLKKGGKSTGDELSPVEIDCRRWKGAAD